jgi:CBS domain-containing protein
MTATISKEHIMTDASAQQSSQPPPTPDNVADVMRPPLTTVEQDDHVAAAAYLMKHAGETALTVLDAHDQPIGIITEADIAHAVADGKDVNSVRIHDLMTTHLTVVNTTTSVRDAARIMTAGRFRHLPVVGDAGLVGMVDITDVCRALIDTAIFQLRRTGMAKPE